VRAVEAPQEVSGVFNIASGKLGHRTKFLTARKSDPTAIEVTVDLNQMQRERSYEVPAEIVGKPPDFVHGTVVEVSGWWPDGNPNHGFVRKLAAYSTSTIATELSRRYATILREQRRVDIDQPLRWNREYCFGQNLAVSRNDAQIGLEGAQTRQELIVSKAFGLKHG
jgi:hypothetical protein